MSPFRLTIPGKHFRLLLAVLFAAVVHGALVIIKFSPPPVTLPAVSLPRSVSVFLGQKRAVETPVQEAEQVSAAAEPAEEITPVEPEALVPVEKQVAPPSEKTEKVPEPQIEGLQPLPEPVTEEVVSPVQQVEAVLEKGAAERMIEKASPEPAGAKTAPSLPDNGGVSLAGTVQEAYPRYRLNDPPPYPRLARKRGQQGTVVLGVLVNREGGVAELQIEESSGYGLLDRAALKAVRKWRFEPGRRGDLKVTMRVRVPVTFTLK